MRLAVVSSPEMMTWYCVDFTLLMVTTNVILCDVWSIVRTRTTFLVPASVSLASERGNGSHHFQYPPSTHSLIISLAF